MPDLILQGALVSEPFKTQKGGFILKMFVKTANGGKVFSIYSKDPSAFPPVASDGSLTVAVDVQDFCFLARDSSAKKVNV
jgi:hypothetical protein